MKKFLYLWLFSVIFILPLQGQNSFEIDLDTEEDNIVWDAASDSNGNVILVGDIGPFIGLDYDAYILKVEPDGNYTEKRFDLPDTVTVFSTVEALDNGQYFVVGAYNAESNYYKRDHLWVVILDQDLTLIKEASYRVRDPYFGFGTKMRSIVDHDGNIVLAASAIYEDTVNRVDFSDFAFYKFNQPGDTLLSRYYSYFYNELPYEFRQMPNSNNLMLVEQSTHYNGHDELLFLDPGLNVLKINQYDNDDTHIHGDLSSDVWVTDTSFLISGQNSWDMGSYSEQYIAVYLSDTSAKFHQELVLNKMDTSDYPARLNSMAYANDSTIYIGGFQVYMGFWLVDPTIVELYMIDKDMNLHGYKELGGDANYEVWGIIATDDDGCLIYGTSHTNDSVPERDVYIWKVLRDDVNIITSVENISPQIQQARVWPNPVQDELFIGTGHINLGQEIWMQIFNITGRKMTDRRLTGEGNAIKVNVSNLETGTYIYNLTVGHETYSGKFLKQ